MASAGGCCRLLCADQQQCPGAGLTSYLRDEITGHTCMRLCKPLQSPHLRTAGCCSLQLLVPPGPAWFRVLSAPLRLGPVSCPGPWSALLVFQLLLPPVFLQQEGPTVEPCSLSWTAVPSLQPRSGPGGQQASQLRPPGLLQLESSKPPSAWGPAGPHDPGRALRGSGHAPLGPGHAPCSLPCYRRVRRDSGHALRSLPCSGRVHRGPHGSNHVLRGPLSPRRTPHGS